MASNKKNFVINPNPSLQEYYTSLESRIYYKLFLGDTRHFGYYPTASSSPFPIGKALRAMEAELYKALQCPKGSRVLDAGCGVGHVALYMARAGDFNVECIDVVEQLVAKAKRNIRSAGMQESISAQVGDYHHLEPFENASFDGIYTMETLSHATDPLKVLKEFLRLLKPGGRIVLHEYDQRDADKDAKQLADTMKKLNQLDSMPANHSFDHDALKYLLKEAGFEDVQLRDMSEHIAPILRLFYILAIIPYLVLKFFHLEHHFVNVMAGVEGYRCRSMWRYTQLTGRKKL